MKRLGSLLLASAFLLCPILLSVAADPGGAGPLLLESVPATVQVRSGERVGIPFVLRNPNDTAEAWNLRAVDSNGRSLAIEDLLESFISGSEGLLASIPNRVNFAGGLTGTSIPWVSPGSQNPFDRGNTLTTAPGGAIAYSDRIVTTSAAVGTGGRYFTLKLPGLFLLAADTAGPLSLEAGGYGTAFTRSVKERFTILHAGREWTVLTVARKSTSTDPAVQQVFLIDEPGATLDLIGNGISSELFARARFSKGRRVIFATFGLPSTNPPGTLGLENFARALLALVPRVPGRTELTPPSGQLDGGAQIPATLSLDATGLAPGEYPVALEARTATSFAREAFTLRVGGPVLDWSGSLLSHAGLTIAPPETIRVAIDSPGGEEIAWSARTLDAGPWISLPRTSGVAGESLELVFSPKLAGAAGDYRGTIEVSTPGATFLLPVSYAVDTPNFVGIVTHPMTPSAYALNNGLRAGSVLALDPSTGTIRKTIRVGKGAVDFEISPDVSALYVVSATDLEITRIALPADEKSGVVKLPAEQFLETVSASIPRITAGYGGKVYYTDSASRPVLHLLDFELGKVLASFRPEAFPSPASPQLGVLDLVFNASSRRLHVTRRQSTFAYARLDTIDPSGDQFRYVSEQLPAEANVAASTSDKLFTDLSGSRAFTGRVRYPLSPPGPGGQLYSQSVVGISAYGDLVITGGTIHRPDTADLLASHPAGSILAVAPDQSGLIYYDSFTKTFRHWAFPEEIRPPPAGIVPEPADGLSLPMGENTLRWSAQPGAESYRIYVGSSAEAVRAAAPGSPLERGLLSGTSLSLDPPLPTGTYFWRIDAIVGGVPVAGSVWSFGVAPFRVAPATVTLKAPSGALPQTVVLGVLGANESPLSWSAVSDQPWLRFAGNPGAPGVPLSCLLDPAGLEARIHPGSVRVSSGGFTIEVPVVLSVFAPDLQQIIPDPARALAYGLHTGSGGADPAYVVVIDPATGGLIRSWHFDHQASGFAVHPGEDRLYVPMSTARQIHAVDLATGQIRPPISLPGWNLAGTITPGRRNRLFLQQQTTTSAIHQIDTQAGTDMGALPGLEPQTAIITTPYATWFDESRHRILRVFRAGLLQEIDVSTDQPALARSIETGSIASNLELPVVLSSRSGDRIGVNLSLRDQDFQATLVLASAPRSLTGDGEVYATSESIHWSDGGAAISTLPANLTAITFSSDDRYLVAWDATAKRVVSISLASIGDRSAPYPRPEQRLDRLPEALSWMPVADAATYRILLGPSADTVALIGTTSLTSFPLPAGMVLPGSRIHWRIEAIAQDGRILSTGQTLWFDFPFPDHAIDPGPLAEFGSGGAELTQHGFLLGTNKEMRWFDFEPTTATATFRQAFPMSSVDTENRFLDAGRGLSFATDGRSILTGLPYFTGSPANAGRGFVFSSQADRIWRRTRGLAPPVAGQDRRFGTSAAMAGGLALVGESASSTGTGAVQTYLPDSDWKWTATLRPSDGAVGDEFGAALALSGNRVLVAAPGRGASSGRTGRAYIFEHSPASGLWSQVAMLQPAATSITTNTARAVAIDGDRAAIGSLESDSVGNSSVTLFDASAGWRQSASIRASGIKGASGSFGKSLQLDGDLLFVGDPGATWKNSRHGVVWVFRDTGSAWIPLAPVVPPVASGALGFGTSISARDGWLLVGSVSNAGMPVMVRTRANANRRPEFTSHPVSHLAAGVPFDISVEARDDEGDPLDFSLNHAPDWLRLEEARDGGLRLVGIPPREGVSFSMLQIEVRDNRGGTALQTSEIRILADATKPVVTLLPDVRHAGSGQHLEFRPLVTGTTPIRYQWNFRGKALPGEVHPVLSLQDVSPMDAGPYTLVATNPAGSTESSPSILVVRPPNRKAGDWTTFGGSEVRGGRHPATLARHRWVKAWSTAPVTGSISFRTVAADNLAFSIERRQGEWSAVARDLRTGAEHWRTVFPPASGQMNPPTYHDRTLYVQESNGLNSRLWSVDSTDGRLVWSAPFTLQGGKFEAPAVSESGIFIDGGRFGGIYGFNHDGTERFFAQMPQVTNWTPTIANGRLFSWSFNRFSEHGPGDGIPRWSLSLANRPGTEVGLAPVIQGDLAVVLGERLSCVDLNTRSVRWTRATADPLFGDPAVDDQFVYVINGRGVGIHDLSTGDWIRDHETGADLSSPLLRPIGQPLVWNDFIACANQFNTWIFRRDDTSPPVTLPVGGQLSYKDGYLLIANNTHLEAWLANAPPQPGPGYQPEVAVAANVPDGHFPLGDSIVDEDPGDTLAWSIASVSRPEVFRTLEINPVTGDLTVVYNPWQSGTAAVVLRITDSAGNVTETTLTFTVPAHPVPALGLAEKLVLNRQTGLYEHIITVNNSGAREVAGFDLAITGLPAGVILNNASGNDGTTWTVQHRKPLAAGASVTLVLEYYTPVRGAVIKPRVAVHLVTEPESDPAAGDPGLAVDRCEVLADGLLIEFTSVPGRLYEIQYSDNARDWKLSPIRIRAAGNRTQWIDRGPPRTDSRPQDKASRFYRVREVPATAGP